MDRLRYPIGRFEGIPNSTADQRAGWMEEIKQCSRKLRFHVQNLTLEQLHTPYRSGGWTVQQVIHHMADNDMNAYIRFKRALTEDQPAASTYKEDLWADLSDYQETPIEISMAILESLHARFAILLDSLTPLDFERTFTSPTHGLMSLDIALQRFAWHNRHHIEQITSVKERLEW
ncbi:putative metal-dependent hydrolase [Paenibacillus sp. 5J-6]|uniref:Putative metal-dependent hydrolase n=1 Tax=Paenibacillus silvestris TaxID=2606219 RepID=A0A6L8VBR2_9BACL|nr:putative metal-dependent hydrolase [Paenibacillus silvestris]MZQ87076.1 putative metal-dependent hydrolase [Paenibacillus silvestris]